MRRAAGMLIAVVAVVGIGCTPPPDGSTVLAVAYTNVDGIDGYDETADVLIAKLIDSNEDGIVSVGDTAVTGRYPLDSDATSFGTFQTTTHTVTGVINAFFEQVLVEVGADTEMEWMVAPELAQWSEIDEISQAFRQTVLVDGHVAGWGNAIQADPLSPSPSAPDTYVRFSDLGADNDESFLEVDILV